MHYQPQGKDFILYNGKQKFNRALYGTNTGFRVEAGDLPEFALYMPGMGGNCKLGIIVNNKSKWITEADSIQTIYRAGSMLYEIQDSLLGKGKLILTVLALADVEGMVVKVTTEHVTANVDLVIVYGGATGKKFSRDGDIGADPESSFYLKPEYCKGNTYKIMNNNFELAYAQSKGASKKIIGIFPNNTMLQQADAEQQQSPLSAITSSSNAVLPIVTAKLKLPLKEATCFVIQKPDSNRTYHNIDLQQQFIKAQIARMKLARRIVLETPDEYINPLAGALSMAADAIWEDPTYLHGAVAWRMRLNAWRGAYAADALGWHDRARKHFDSYALSQVTNIPAGNVVADTALHLARQLEKMGTAMFSNGYICRNPNGDIRPHHYDMNLVFIDQLLNHFNYTGDTAYVKQMWSMLQRHLAWEKRNFDPDNDGLYDAYACIWASDALQYSGGGVTHSSAYNYRANKTAAQLAILIGEDPQLYLNEADKIITALNQKLWIKDKGWFAEYKDLLGLQLVHPAAGLWTVYHAIDEGAADALQQYQLLRYVDNNLPHIPVKAKGLKDDGYYLLSTTNWQPYTWSINNVALAEVLHTSLAYWQSNEHNNAFKLWKSALVESMYMSASPGGFEQLSFYDAIRGELYRDFADPIGVAARTLTEGLFGIKPNALNDSLTIRPGFPTDWKFAKLKLPFVQFDYKQNDNIATYTIVQNFNKLLNTKLQLKAVKDDVASITINNKSVNWNWLRDAVGEPMIEVEIGKQKSNTIKITWKGNDIETIKTDSIYTINTTLKIQLTKAKPVELLDVQGILANKSITNNTINFTTATDTGHHTFFARLQQGNAEWLAPIDVYIKPIIEIKIANESSNNLECIVINNSSTKKAGELIVNNTATDIIKLISIPAKGSTKILFDVNLVKKGTNTITFKASDRTVTQQNIINWSVSNASTNNYETIHLQPYFNDKLNQIFKNKYLSPRPATVSLQMPWQGIGNWCYPLIEPVINDSGVKAKAINNIIKFNDIPFATPSSNDKNIAFTSKWDNFPDSISLLLNGNASHAYLLMAGTTNHQQSRLTNAKVVVNYKDGTSDSLLLINPNNWYPIEQDYYTDGYAFTTDGPKPYRLILKTGEFTNKFNKYTTIKGFSNYAIDGGAATVLDLPLNKNKELQSLSLITLANEVIVGLMSVTLVR